MKAKRNDPCHCGSGKKYKKCCLAVDRVPEPKPKAKRKFSRQHANMIVTHLLAMVDVPPPDPFRRQRREPPQSLEDLE